jgi:preprotein translocase, SecE subunit, bacterial
MAATNEAAAAAKQPGGGVVQYLREVRGELKKSEWPSREQLIRLTQVVLTLIVIVAIYCGGLDALLGLVTNRLFNR